MTPAENADQASPHEFVIIGDKDPNSVHDRADNVRKVSRWTPELLNPLRFDKVFQTLPTFLPGRSRSGYFRRPRHRIRARGVDIPLGIRTRPAS